jgi:hypothetical protein
MIAIFFSAITAARRMAGSIGVVAPEETPWSASLVP